MLDPGSLDPSKHAAEVTREVAGHLWRAMNDGIELGFVGKLLRFNGGLFAKPTALPLDEKSLGLLFEAAKCTWAEVDPAIFGTLLERALDPKERHRLGAHYTPRAYVERLVRPTIEEPMRADWDLVQAEVRQLVASATGEGEKVSLSVEEGSKLSGSRPGREGEAGLAVGWGDDEEEPDHRGRDPGSVKPKQKSSRRSVQAGRAAGSCGLT